MAETKLPEGDGKYMKVNIVARRARDINKQKMSSLYEDDSPDPMDVALMEFKNGLLAFEFRHHLVGTGEDYRSG
ncbi:hypothetical protein BH09SUM1_BH09SUM1_32720 [soil metagenome]